MPGGENRNQNRGSIKWEKPEKMLRDSVLYARTFHPTTGPRLFCSHFGVPKNSMSPSNVMNTVSMAAFFNNENFIINIYMHKMKAF